VLMPPKKDEDAGKYYDVGYDTFFGLCVRFNHTDLARKFLATVRTESIDPSAVPKVVNAYVVLPFDVEASPFPKEETPFGDPDGAAVPLVWAATVSNNAEMVELLVLNGADPDLTCSMNFHKLLGTPDPIRHISELLAIMKGSPGFDLDPAIPRLLRMTNH